MASDPRGCERREAERLVLRFEVALQDAVVAALAHWLIEVRRLVLADGGAIPQVAADALGEAELLWLRSIRDLVVPRIGELFGEAFQRQARTADISALPYRLEHIETVESRLKLFPAEQFEFIRMEIAEAVDNGEPIDQVRDRIAAQLDFDTTRGARGEQADTRAVQGEIDAIEKRLEEHENAGPGEPGRLAAADERRLRAERGRLYDELWRLKAGWEWKARRIARTESLGALSGGTYAAALADERALGETFWKEWLSTEDERTRLTHRAADGQVRILRDPFDVGAANLQFPGDPSGPGQEVINCRCVPLILDSQELDDLGIDPGDLPDGGRQDGVQADASPDQGGTMTVTTDAPAETGAELPDGWRGVLAPLDTRSGDGRIIATPAELRVREAPRALLWQESLEMGHGGATVAGRIDRAWVSGGLLYGEGAFDLGSEAGREAARQLGEGWSNGVSVDLDDLTMSEAWYTADGERIDDDELDELDWEELWESGARPVMIAEDWRLMTATLVSQPAFDEARLEPVYGYASDTDDSDDRDDEDGERTAAGAPAVMHAVIVAGGTPGYRAGDFADPGFERPTPLQVDDDGRVSGHLALWSTCHTSFPDMCVTPPRSATGYSWFHTGEVVTDTGPLPVGKVTLGTGHADAKAGARPAAEHYDDTGTCVAVVRAGEDEHGIWVAGHLTEQVSDEQVAELRRSPLSGDWRRVNGTLELVAALAVNVPGFPVPRALAASGAGGRQLSLVAAGALPCPRARRRARGGPELDYARLARMISDEQTRTRARAARAEQLARRIGRDSVSRAAAVAARIGEYRP